MSVSLCCSNDTAGRHLAVPLLPTAGHHIPHHRTGRRPIFGQRGKCDQNIDGIVHSNATHYSPIWRVNAIFTHCCTTSLANVPTDNSYTGLIVHILQPVTHITSHYTEYSRREREVGVIQLNVIGKVRRCNTNRARLLFSCLLLHNYKSHLASISPTNYSLAPPRSASYKISFSWTTFRQIRYVVVRKEEKTKNSTDFIKFEFTIFDNSVRHRSYKNFLWEPFMWLLPYIAALPFDK